MNYKVASIVIVILVLVVGAVVFFNGTDSSEPNEKTSDTKVSDSNLPTNPSSGDEPEKLDEPLLEPGDPDPSENFEELPSADPNAGLDKSPDFSFPDFSGNIVTSESFRGKNIVVNSWATWCPFCVNELPDFAEAQKEFGDKVTIMPIDRAESTNRQVDFLSGIEINTDDLLFLTDSRDNFYRNIGGFSMPETIFVNEDGFIVEHKRGFMTLEQMRASINNLLQN